MKYILFLGLFSLITLVSCNKNEKIKITDDLLKLCFKTDTYWVYIDSVNNNIDSVYVVNYDYYYRKQYGMTPDHSYDVEYYNFNTRSSQSIEYAGYEIVSNHLTKFMQSETSVRTNYHPIYYDYDGITDWIGNQSEMSIIHLDSVFVYDQYYYRVLKVDYPVDTAENFEKNTYYTNSQYGILRHEIYSDTVLLSNKILMRKNIVR